MQERWPVTSPRPSDSAGGGHPIQQSVGSLRQRVAGSEPTTIDFLSNLLVRGSSGACPVKYGGRIYCCRRQFCRRPPQLQAAASNCHSGRAISDRGLRSMGWETVRRDEQRQCHASAIEDFKRREVIYRQHLEDALAAINPKTVTRTPEEAAELCARLRRLTLSLNDLGTHWRYPAVDLDDHDGA